MRGLDVEHIGPAVSIQDAGRPGGLGLGLSRGGAVDRMAYLAGCALLDQPIGTAALEMAGFGGRFRFASSSRFALTGAPMRATLDGVDLEWNASHLAGPDSVLDIGGVVQGVYGYLHVGGGIENDVILGGRGFHGIAGLGRVLTTGDHLPMGADEEVEVPLRRLKQPSLKGPIRVMAGPQTALFAQPVLESFEAAVFRRSPKANRQGVRLDHEGKAFTAAAQLSQVSDFICEGDVQMTGDGTPYVLLVDCQTMGGYPRIGTVLPVDLPRIAQAQAGDPITFKFVTEEEADKFWKDDKTILADLKRRSELRIRDPREMTDLLSYDLIDRPSGDVVS